MHHFILAEKSQNCRMDCSGLSISQIASFSKRTTLSACFPSSGSYPEVPCFVATAQFIAAVFRVVRRGGAVLSRRLRWTPVNRQTKQ